MSEGTIRVALRAIAGLKIHRGLVASVGLVSFQSGNVLRNASLADLRAVVFRLVQPGLQVARCQFRQALGLGEGPGAGIAGAQQLIERSLGNAHIVGCSYFLGADP